MANADTSIKPIKKQKLCRSLVAPPTPARRQKNAPPRQKQLQIITLRRRTIELKSKQDRKGSQFEDTSARYFSKMKAADPTPIQRHCHRHAEIENKRGSSVGYGTDGFWLWRDNTLHENRNPASCGGN